MTSGHCEMARVSVGFSRVCAQGIGETHCFSQIDFTVFWEQDRKGRLLCEGASGVVLALEGGDLPLVDVVRVPPAKRNVKRSVRGRREGGNVVFVLTACLSRVL